jgi:chromosome partitioning protein
MLLAVAGLKGGTGKTSLSVSLAAAAAERGRAALLVDADPRGDAHSWTSLATAFPGTSVLPGIRLPLGAGSLDLRALALGLDLCVVDCPGSDPARVGTVLDAADFCLVPCAPSALDVWSLGATFEAIREARGRNPALGAAVLVNRFTPGTILGRTVATQLERAGFPLMRTRVGQRVGFAEAIGAGMSITAALPHSDAARDVEDLLDEVDGLRAHPSAGVHALQ